MQDAVDIAAAEGGVEDERVVPCHAVEDVGASGAHDVTADQRCGRARSEVAVERVVAVAAVDDVVAAVEGAAAGERTDPVNVAGDDVASLVPEDVVVAPGEPDRHEGAR